MGDSTMGDMVTLLLSSPAAPPAEDVAGTVAARSCLISSGGGDAALVSLIRSPLRFDFADLFDLFDIEDGERCSSASCWRWNCADVATVADRGCDASTVLACPRKSPAEFECDNARAVLSLSDIEGRPGVGVVVSSSCSTGDIGDMGWLERDKELLRREELLFFLVLPCSKSSVDLFDPRMEATSETDLSLFSGEGGTTVTFRFIESLSPS